MYHPIIAEAIRREQEIRDERLRQEVRNGTLRRPRGFRAFIGKVTGTASEARQTVETAGTAGAVAADAATAS